MMYKFWIISLTCIIVSTAAAVMIKLNYKDAIFLHYNNDRWLDDRGHPPQQCNLNNLTKAKAASVGNLLIQVFGSHNSFFTKWVTKTKINV